MKRTITFLMGLVAVAVLVFFLLHHKKQAVQSMPELGIQSTNVPLRGNNVLQNNISGQTNLMMKTAVPMGNEPKPGTEAEMNAKARQMLEARNHPVELWGKVVDQSDAALSGVKVEVEFNQFAWPPQKYPNGTTTKQELFTDPDGGFHVSDSSATGVHIILKKDGYEQASRNGYGSSMGGGSYGNPVIFKMWSTNVHEQLITGEKQFSIVPDGRSYVIDLVKGTISETGSGDLKVWVKRPKQITYGEKYDWSCEVDVISGGLLQKTDSSSSRYSAPTNGYVPSFQFEQKVGSGWGDTTGPKQFYVKLDNGQEYGLITIELFAHYNDHLPGLVRIQYAINPSGSRILR